MLAVQITLLQVLIVLVTKLISKLMIRAPFLRDTRKRNQKLQGMAALRKAEIRRMGDKGQQFIVKQEAKKEGIDADDAIKMLSKTTGEEPEAPKGLKGLCKRAKAAV
jgi:hypothetical protein